MKRSYYLFYRYDQLLRDERLTSQEIVAFDKKFESWAQLGPAKVDLDTKNRPTKLSSHRDVTKDLPPEVAAFDVSNQWPTFHYKADRH